MGIPQRVSLIQGWYYINVLSGVAKGGPSWVPIYSLGTLHGLVVLRGGGRTRPEGREARIDVLVG